MKRLGVMLVLAGALMALALPAYAQSSCKAPATAADPPLTRPTTATPQIFSLPTDFYGCAWRITHSFTRAFGVCTDAEGIPIFDEEIDIWKCQDPSLYSAYPRYSCRGRLVSVVGDLVSFEIQESGCCTWSAEASAPRGFADHRFIVHQLIASPDWGKPHSDLRWIFGGWEATPTLAAIAQKPTVKQHLRTVFVNFSFSWLPSMVRPIFFESAFFQWSHRSVSAQCFDQLNPVFYAEEGLDDQIHPELVEWCKNFRGAPRLRKAIANTSTMKKYAGQETDCFFHPKDLTGSSYAFERLEGDQVMIHLGLGHGCEAARGRFTEFRFLYDAEFRFLSVTALSFLYGAAGLQCRLRWAEHYGLLGHQLRPSDGDQWKSKHE